MSRILLELTFPQLVKKFLYCMEPEDPLPYPNIPPSHPTLRLINAAHCTPLLFLQDPFYFILLFPHRSFKWHLSFRIYPPKFYMHLSSLLCVLHAPPTIYSRFHHPNNIWRGVHTLKLRIMRFSPVSCYLVPLRPKCLPQHRIVHHSKPILFPQSQTPRLTNVYSITQIILLCILIFTILDKEGKYRRICRTVPGIPTV